MITLSDPLLAFHADALSDLEAARIANENRYRQLIRDVTDADGETRGFGLPPEHPDALAYQGIVEAFTRAEAGAVKRLEQRMRQHPLGPWVAAQRGIGNKQAARLLASIGDPYWHSLEDRPRTVGELWAYAGYGQIDRIGASGVVRRRRRGEQVSWSDEAKMRAHLVATSIVKTTGPWREVYDAARAKYADAVHVVPCVRCGPAGHPAPEGSALSAGHRHARALRIAAKEVLKGLWLEARRLHAEADVADVEAA